jgi:hypothetical protein
MLAYMYLLVRARIYNITLTPTPASTPPIHVMPKVVITLFAPIMAILLLTRKSSIYNVISEFMKYLITPRLPRLMHI